MQYTILSFDDPANKEFNKTLMKNVQGVISQNENTTMIKRKFNRHIDKL